MTTQVRVEQHGRVVVATLDNPPHAFMTNQMFGELTELIARSDSDDSIGAVILTGAHPDRFIAHYDVAELLAVGQAGPQVSARQARTALRSVRALGKVPGVGRALDHSPAAGLRLMNSFHDATTAIGRSGAVFIAAINGAALGGGCELAMACDLRYMARGEDHLIGQPEITVGIPPGGGGTQRLPRLIGVSRALEMLLDPQPLTPEAAHGIGLVHQVVNPDELLEYALAAGERISRRPKTAVRTIKRSVTDGASLPLRNGLDVEAAQFAEALSSPEAQDLMTLYVGLVEHLEDVPANDPAFRAALLDGTWPDRAAELLNDI